MKKISVFTLLLTLIAGGVFAQTARTLYNRTNNNNWNNTATWQDSATNAQALSIPTEYDTVYIGRNNNKDIKIDAAAEASKIIVLGQYNNKFAMTNKASLDCDSLIFESNNGNNEIKGLVKGTVVCRNGGYVKLNDAKAVVTGTIIVESGSILDIANNKSKVSGNIIVKSGGRINNFGNLKANNFTNGTLIVEDGAILDGNNNALNPSNSNSTNATYAIELKNGWNFVGLPLHDNIAPLAADDAPAIWALRFNYDDNEWSENYLHYVEDGQKDTLAKGYGMFVYLAEPSYYLRLGSGTVSTIDDDITYPYEQERTAAQGRWFALANPFTSSLNIASFLTANGSRIHGGCVYRYVAGNPGERGTFETLSEGTIKIGQGFFVNMADNETTITFNPSTAKSKSAEREFVRVSVATEGYKVPVMFAQNDDASDGYDIYDANKMFGDGSVAEPYLVCNGINLCKEEVLSSSYTATMNVKSSESRSVEIVADNIPEGYSLTLIDGALEVVMNQGDVYTTDIAEGENADRFKLLITKNNVSIADVAEAESIRVVNNNRSIRVYGGKSVRTEVYNALGQKVYETSDRVFDLNNVASGAYILKVSDGKTVNSTKIVVE